MRDVDRVQREFEAYREQAEARAADLETALNVAFDALADTKEKLMLAEAENAARRAVVEGEPKPRRGRKAPAFDPAQEELG